MFLDHTEHTPGKPADLDQASVVKLVGGQIGDKTPLSIQAAKYSVNAKVLKNSILWGFVAACSCIA